MEDNNEDKNNIKTLKKAMGVLKISLENVFLKYQKNHNIT